MEQDFLNDIQVGTLQRFNREICYFCTQIHNLPESPIQDGSTSENKVHYV